MEDGIHHVIARGDHRERIFDDDDDRVRFLRRYAEVAVRYRWVLLTYCLMGNHVHLVVETPDPHSVTAAEISSGISRGPGTRGAANSDTCSKDASSRDWC